MNTVVHGHRCGRARIHTWCLGQAISTAARNAPSVLGQVGLRRTRTAPLKHRRGAGWRSRLFLKPRSCAVVPAKSTISREVLHRQGDDDLAVDRLEAVVVDGFPRAPHALVPGDRCRRGSGGPAWASSAFEEIVRRVDAQLLDQQRPARSRRCAGRARSMARKIAVERLGRRVLSYQQPPQILARPCRLRQLQAPAGGMPSWKTRWPPNVGAGRTAPISAWWARLQAEGHHLAGANTDRPITQSGRLFGRRRCRDRSAGTRPRVRSRKRRRT